jgi:hypothetical protein
MTGRYVVIEAWSTGTHDYARKDTLDDAPDLRDELRKERPRGRTGPSFFVFDSDDPERGPLEHKDTYEEAHA